MVAFNVNCPPEKSCPLFHCTLKVKNSIVHAFKQKLSTCPLSGDEFPLSTQINKHVNYQKNVVHLLNMYLTDIFPLAHLPVSTPHSRKILRTFHSLPKIQVPTVHLKHCTQFIRLCTVYLYLMVICVI